MEITKLSDSNDISGIIELAEKYDNTITRKISELVSPQKKLQATIINLKKKVGFKLLPNTSSKSVDFHECKKNSKIQEISGKYGVYIFVLSLEDVADEDHEKYIGEFGKQWDEYKSENTDSKIPGFNKKNKTICTIKNDKKCAVLYIGKSEMLDYRLKLHIKGGSKGTYCLRINDFFNSDDNSKYVIKYCSLSTDNEDIVTILPRIERMLHNNFPVLIGNK